MFRNTRIAFIDFEGTMVTSRIRTTYEAGCFIKMKRNDIPYESDYKVLKCSQWAVEQLMQSGAVVYVLVCVTSNLLDDFRRGIASRDFGIPTSKLHNSRHS